ncbi:MAG: hypothetical protein K0S24_265 [Sphingobacterium sp.]|jgi:hypothetical protein|nr:hypothetical protein [Sphingobacterium sp.]
MSLNQKEYRRSKASLFTIFDGLTPFMAHLTL